MGIAIHYGDALLASEYRSSAVVTIRADWTCFPPVNPFPCDLADFSKFEPKMPKTFFFSPPIFFFGPRRAQGKFFFFFLTKAEIRPELFF